MSIRFQADNDLKRTMVDATLRREPSVDFQTAEAAGLDNLDDELALRRASEQDRIPVSHDKRTMPVRLVQFVDAVAIVQVVFWLSFPSMRRFGSSRRPWSSFGRTIGPANG
ncbi:MAG TPA: hypothetical protein VNY05_38750 [Candidatus Acidoferrales bacterium]|nr:hypothetical protein [Candidatus Acidoferrales bacterium]